MGRRIRFGKKRKNKISLEQKAFQIMNREESYHNPLDRVSEIIIEESLEKYVKSEL